MTKRRNASSCTEAPASQPYHLFLEHLDPRRNADGRIVEAACWAHARRKYYDVYVMDRSPTAHEALARIGELYAIEREIRGQAPKDRLAARGTRSAPLLEALQTWLRATHTSLSVKSPLAGAIQYTLGRYKARSGPPLPFATFCTTLQRVAPPDRSAVPANPT